MARPKRQKPYDPRKADAERQARELAEISDAKARVRDPSRWGEDPLSKSRQAEMRAKGAVLNVDGRGRLREGSHAADVWSELKSRRSLTDEQYVAVRRLEADMIVRAGFGMAGKSYERVQRSGDAAAITDEMVEAGRRVDDALMLVGPPSCRILKALIEPKVYGDAIEWRPIVEKLTGETNDRVQAGLLRHAAQALADVYPDIERLETQRRDASYDRRDAAELDRTLERLRA